MQKSSLLMLDPNGGSGVGVHHMLNWNATITNNKGKDDQYQVPGGYQILRIRSGPLALLFLWPGVDYPVSDHGHQTVSSFPSEETAA